MNSGDESLSLFDPPRPVPDGFIYREEFLTADEEQRLIGEIRNLDLTPFQYYRFTGRRRTISFGWQYEFGQKDIAPAPEIPSFLLPLRARAAPVFNIEPSTLVHISILEYPPGAPIGWHRDIPHFGIVIGVSLSSACRMRFRKYERARSKGKRDEVFALELQARSIYLMSGASRESWQHSIPPVQELRYAIMMRTLKTSRKESANGR
jgi:alkylated DNA repair dioxygenase AlkB